MRHSYTPRRRVRQGLFHLRESLFEELEDFLGLVALGALPFFLGVLEGGFVGLEEEDELAAFA